MTFTRSITCVAMAFASMMFSACGAADSDENAVETQMALEGEMDNEANGYGYEMIPLQLHGDVIATEGEAWLPNGRVAPQAVLREATEHIDGMRGCYEAALVMDPALSGQVRAIMEFRANGSVRSVVFDGPALDPEFAACMTGELGTMALPASNAGVLEVHYPINLDPPVLN